MAEAASDQKLGTLLRMHEAAFQQIGGVPEEILYDRMKTVWLGTDERGEIVWHPVFLDFARYWGFTPRLCRPYRAQTKGKVESGVKYVRRNFLCGLQGREPAAWRSERPAARVDRGVANQRVHGTTHEQVAVRWDVEQFSLQSLAGSHPIPTWMANCAKWRAMHMLTGKAVGIRCPGSMRARKSGCRRSRRKWMSAWAVSGSPCTARRDGNTA